MVLRSSVPPSPASVQRLRAFSLHRTPYRDSDLIVDLFTDDDGLLGALARGGRKAGKRFGASFQTFAMLDVVLGRGRRGELWEVREAAVVCSYAGLQRSYARIALAGFALRRVRTAVREGLAEPGLFDCLADFMAACAEAPQAQLDALGLAFFARLAGHLGFAPDLDRCASCGRAAEANRTVEFEPALDAIRCQGCGGGRISLGAETRRVLNYHFQRAGGLQHCGDMTWQEAAHAVVESSLLRHVPSLEPWVRAAPSSEETAVAQGSPSVRTA